MIEPVTRLFFVDDRARRLLYFAAEFCIRRGIALNQDHLSDVVHQAGKKSLLAVPHPGTLA